MRYIVKSALNDFVVICLLIFQATSFLSSIEFYIDIASVLLMVERSLTSIVIDASCQGNTPLGAIRKTL
jgi:hypothetical protein